MKRAWYKWTWANGMVTFASGYDRTEKAAMEKKYGKLLTKEKAY